MFAKAGIKKKLLMLALAMAMAASLVCGTLFVRADAEAVNAEDLITVSGGATVTAAQRYTLKNAVGDLAAGTQVGPAGLYVSSGRENGSISGTQEYYEIALNGIFTGSVHINWQAPNEGFWEQHKEVAFRVQSISDPAAAFEFRMGGQWQQYGYVTYEWQGETLWRSQNTYYSDANPAASDYSYTQALSTDNGFAQWAPMIGNMDNADNHDYVGYFGVELEEDGTVNVAAVGAHDGNHREVVASFCEDPETFEPITDTERGSEPNLPKIDLSAGYTVTIRVQNYHNIGGWTADSMADFLLVSVEESETGDPSQPENGGTVYTFDGATSESAPQFYTNWQTIPVIRAEGYEETDYSYIGAEIELPRATATVGGVVSDFAGTITVTDPSGAQTQVTDGVYEVKSRGEHTVRYEQNGSYFEFGFYVYDKPFAVEDVVTAEGAALSYGEDVRGLAGITVSSEGGAYSGTLAGSFSGASEGFLNTHCLYPCASASAESRRKRAAKARRREPSGSSPFSAGESSHESQYMSAPAYAGKYSAKNDSCIRREASVFSSERSASEGICSESTPFSPASSSYSSSPRRNSVSESCLPVQKARSNPYLP